MNRVLCIAEIGSCPDGQWDKAARLVHEAKQAGADICKAQYWSNPERLANRRHAPQFLDLYRRYQMPPAWLPRLTEECATVGIAFACTTYLEEDIAVVAPHVHYQKIASFEAHDAAFIQAHRPHGKPTIISTGMCDEKTLIDLRGIQGDADWEVYLLHCVSSYPAPLQQINLSVIRNYGLDGFSDHTTSILTGAFAVAAGARIIEKHLRLTDTNPANPDYPHALSPRSFAEYIRFIRVADAAMGEGPKRIMPCEVAMTPFVVHP